MKAIVLIGRILFSYIFLNTILGHFSQSTISFAQSYGVPFASILVPISGIIAFLGGLSILLGYKAKIGAWLIVVFLIPTTLFMHNFWAITDPAESLTQMVMFNKNIAMLGGALILAYFGAGPFSIDSLMKKEPAFEETEKAHVKRVSRAGAMEAEKREKAIRQKQKKDDKEVR